MYTIMYITQCCLGIFSVMVIMVRINNMWKGYAHQIYSPYAHVSIYLFPDIQVNTGSPIVICLEKLQLGGKLQRDSSVGLKEICCSVYEQCPSRVV